MEINIGGLKVDATGAGSRGGHIIGHTSTGKPVYASKHSSHAGFSKQEHLQAKNLHEGLVDTHEDRRMRAKTKGESDFHGKVMKHHSKMAVHHGSQAKRSKSHPDFQSGKVTGFGQVKNSKYDPRKMLGG